ATADAQTELTIRSYIQPILTIIGNAYRHIPPFKPDPACIRVLGSINRAFRDAIWHFTDRTVAWQIERQNELDHLAASLHIQPCVHVDIRQVGVKREAQRGAGMLPSH